DRSFVDAMASDPSSRAIVRAVIDVADALKLHVVAEGVEDRDTWDVLAGLGCDVAQGYYLSRPLAAADLEAWLGGRVHLADAATGVHGTTCLRLVFGGSTPVCTRRPSAARTAGRCAGHELVDVLGDACCAHVSRPASRRPRAPAASGVVRRRPALNVERVQC